MPTRQTTTRARPKKKPWSPKETCVSFFFLIHIVYTLTYFYNFVHFKIIQQPKTVGLKNFNLVQIIICQMSCINSQQHNGLNRFSKCVHGLCDKYILYLYLFSTIKKRLRVTFFRLRFWADRFRRPTLGKSRACV